MSSASNLKARRAAPPTDSLAIRVSSCALNLQFEITSLCSMPSAQSSIRNVHEVGLVFAL